MLQRANIIDTNRPSGGISDLRLAVGNNNHDLVQQILKAKPDLVQNYPDIVLSAIDEEMVWSLLQLELPTSMTFKCQSGTTCSGKSREAGMDYRLRDKII